MIGVAPTWDTSMKFGSGPSFGFGMLLANTFGIPSREIAPPVGELPPPANGTLLPVTPPLGGVVRGLGTAAGPEGRLLTGGFTETMPCGGVFRTMVVGGEGVKTGCIQGVWGA